jgi:hypothetical protein
MIDLAKIAQAQAARAAIPFGSHDRDCRRMCPCCLDRTEARYEFTQVVQTEDGGPLLLARSWTCGSSGSTYTADYEIAPAGSKLDKVVDRREWSGREKSGVHAIAPLSAPEGAGRYHLVGDMHDFGGRS